jgi:hypothetical protein
MRWTHILRVILLELLCFIWSSLIFKSTTWFVCLSYSPFFLCIPFHLKLNFLLITTDFYHSIWNFLILNGFSVCDKIGSHINSQLSLILSFSCLFSIFKFILLSIIYVKLQYAWRWVFISKESREWGTQLGQCFAITKPCSTRTSCLFRKHFAGATYAIPENNGNEWRAVAWEAQVQNTANTRREGLAFWLNLWAKPQAKYSRIIQELRICADQCVL